MLNKNRKRIHETKILFILIKKIINILQFFYAHRKIHQNSSTKYNYFKKIHEHFFSRNNEVNKELGLWPAKT